MRIYGYIDSNKLPMLHTDTELLNLSVELQERGDALKQEELIRQESLLTTQQILDEIF